MSLSQKINEFRFNLDTLDLLNNMGRSLPDTIIEMSHIGFTSNQVNFCISSRSLLNSVLLRLQLYGEKNMSESHVRSSLSILNNMQINNLLDSFFYKLNKSNTTSTDNITEETDCEENQDDNIVSELSRFDQYYSACVKQTNDPTDIVKTSDIYNSFNNWWTEIYEEVVPEKSELKEFIITKLGKPNKNTWSNTVLSS
jgi:hypothetical protein